jgi:2Fe-2S ferredoxin
MGDDIVEFEVVLRSGDSMSTHASPGITVMEAIRNAGIDELLALCGGCCSCATCHVMVESGPADLSKPQSENEDDVLDSSGHRTSSSRLSCQIPVNAELQGARFVIAPEDV